MVWYAPADAFRGGDDEFKLRFDANDKKYNRYQMFSRDGVFAPPSLRKKPGTKMTLPSSA